MYFKEILQYHIWKLITLIPKTQNYWKYRIWKMQYIIKIFKNDYVAMYLYRDIRM